MIFNSSDFIIFFSAFFLTYWFANRWSVKLQNMIVLAGSYFFYGWWNWRFLFLLILSSAVAYFFGILIAKSTDEKRRETFVASGLVLILGSLFFFKYINFFIQQFNELSQALELSVRGQQLNLILPLGISFYTFRIVSYLLDINNEKIEPCINPIIFFSYVSFFPSLMSGPIDRAKTLIPQFERKRTFQYSVATDGLRQILWGLFKKVVIADQCAVASGNILDQFTSMNGYMMIVGAFLYTVQVYADFSGYSDMAIGIARLLGFAITKNFNFPFFAQNIAEYWQRWHISLTSFVTEYVFTPLSFVFRELGKFGMVLAVLVNFILVGFWHGANWTFILFGLLHGCYFIPLIVRGTINKKRSSSKNSLIPSPGEFLRMFGTFSLVMLTNIIFRFETVDQAYLFYRKLFSFALSSFPRDIFTIALGVFEKSTYVNCFNFLYWKVTWTLPVFLLIFFLTEWLGRTNNHSLEKLGLKWWRPIRWALYYLILMSIILWGGKEQQFIYFQF